MTYYIRNGNQFDVAREKSLDIKDFLPVGNYIVKERPMDGPFFLEGVDSFTPIKKLYGSIDRDATRILHTYRERSNSTGVLLTGEKGSGKTLLAKTISIEAAKADIPTIIINTPLVGDKFNKFIQDIDQECIVMFDEFEKIYDSEEQETILTLLDGVFPSKKLFILTCNDKWRIDNHMRNRPGRIFYMLDFVGLEDSFIREYCGDNLENKVHIDKICHAASMFSQFNFDMLKALVEEMNRYNETPNEALRMLNAKPEFGGDSNFKVEHRVNGVLLEINDCDPNNWNGNPLSVEGLRTTYYAKSNSKELLKGNEWKDYRFSTSDLVQVLPKEGRFVFAQGDYELTLVREYNKYFDWNAF